MERNNRRRKKIIFFLILAVACVCAGFLLKEVFFSKPKPNWDNEQFQGELGLNLTEFDGKWYSYNSNLTNILFMGIDSDSATRNDNMPGDAGQADCLMLITLDKEKRTAKVLQIPRDTMTDVDLYDATGKYRSTVKEQIATQYAYSIGGAYSCFATKKTVSELLSDLPIDAYLVMEYSNIATVNDEIGGVTITIPEDYTNIDPAFEKGATLTLTGKQAHDYVRYRDVNVDYSNNDRMKRQRQFIPALIETIRGRMKTDEDYTEILYPIVEKYMLTDLEGEEIKQLMQYEFQVEEIQVLPGESKKGEIYEEFYPDKEKTQKILIEMFYILKE